METHNNSNLEILSCLGEGLNSRVYKAFRHSKELGVRQPVAVKILKSKKIIEVLSQECGKLLRVRSRHCVAIYGWEVLSGYPAIILEYIEGVTLQDLWLSGGLDQRLADEVLAQVVQGVRELNQFGISHGDLNLTNIMVDCEGLVRLLDFGFFNCQYRMTTPEFASSAVMMGEAPDLLSDLVSIEKIRKYLMPSVAGVGVEDLSSRVSAQKDLAQMVYQIWAKRSQEQMPKTRQMKTLKDPAKGHWARRVAVGIFALLFVFQDSQASRTRPIYRIEVRSSGWQEVWADGVAPCYSPCDVRIDRAKVKLIWRGVGGHGARHVHIPEAGVLRLGDSFFR